MKYLSLCCALSLCVLLSQIDLSVSECCHVPLKCEENSKSVERCYDCTEATVYCGNGKCNILGCNCDGGCRAGDSTLWCWNISSGCKGKFFTGRAASLQIKSSGVEDVIQKLDANYDEMVSVNEARQYLIKSGLYNKKANRDLKEMDRNGDGLLSANEIDG